MLESRVCVVTGGTSGIGLATARALASGGATVLVVSRSEAKCAAVADRLRRETGNAAIQYVAADLSSLEQVRRAAGEIRQRFAGINVLVNNAGVSLARRRESADGFEYMFALNHLAPFLLTNLLLDALVAGAPARVVNVSSGMFPQAKLDFDNLQMTRKFSAMRAYANSKLCNILFTLELARRLEGRGVTVNALGPGLVKTNIGMDEGGMFAFGKKLADFFGGTTPEQGADTVVWLATSPEIEGVTGSYFEKRKPKPLEPAAGYGQLAVGLWQVSADLTGLQP